MANPKTEFSLRLVVVSSNQSQTQEFVSVFVMEYHEKPNLFAQLFPDFQQLDFYNLDFPNILNRRVNSGKWAYSRVCSENWMVILVWRYDIRVT